jgi:hypothetical protein
MKQYETYAGQKFEIVHQGDIGINSREIVTAISKTERTGETMLVLDNHTQRIIRPPDYINPIGEDGER